MEDFKERMFVSNEGDGTVVISVDNPYGDLVVLNFGGDRLNAARLKRVISLMEPVVSVLAAIKEEEC